MTNAGGQALGRVCKRLVALFQCRKRSLHCLEDFGAMGQTALFIGQGLPLALEQTERADFIHTPLQLLANAGQGRRLLAGRLEGGLRLGQNTMGLAHRLRLLLQARMAIEQLQLLACLGETLMGMLSMDIHQMLANPLELGKGGHLAVDPGPGAPPRLDASAHQDAAIDRLKAGLIENLGHRGGQDTRHLKLTGDVGTCRTGPNLDGICAVSQQKAHGIDEDGLACTGLACQSREAIGEVEFQGRDGDEIAYRQGSEHRGLSLGVVSRVPTERVDRAGQGESDWNSNEAYAAASRSSRNPLDEADALHAGICE